MAMSGQKRVTAAGAAVALGDQVINGPLMVKALSENTGRVAIGNDGGGDVTTENGFLLSAGEVIIFAFVGNLASLLIDAEQDNEGVSWLCLNV